MDTLIRKNERAPEGPISLHPLGRLGWLWAWNKSVREEDQRNMALEARVKEILAQQEITVSSMEAPNPLLEIFLEQ